MNRAFLKKVLLRIGLAFFVGTLVFLVHQEFRASAGEQKTAENQVRAIALYRSGFNKAKVFLYHQAIADFNQAIQLDPNFAEAYTARAYAKYLIGDKSKAIEDFRSAERVYTETGSHEKARIASELREDFQKELINSNK